MKKLALLCVLVALATSGCGKKKEKKQVRSNIPAKARSVKKNKNLALKDSEDFFDKSVVSDFAFVDDENEAVTKKSNSHKEKDLALVENDIDEALSQEEDFVDGDTEEVGVPLKTVYFDLNHNRIRADQKKIVAEDCNLAKNAAKKGQKVVVQGHCCQLGAPSYNMALSQQRAEAIKKEMVQNGVPAETIQSVGYGSEKPKVFSDKTDRASLIKELSPNRRAEVIVS